MEEAHQKAEGIRNNPANQASNNSNSSSSSGSSSGNSSNSSSSSSDSSSKDLFHALTNAVLSQGYFNSDTWSAVRAFYPMTRKDTNNVSDFPGPVYASAGNIGGFDLNISNDITKDQWTKIGYYALGYLNYSINLNKQVKELQGQFNPYEKLKEGIEFWKTAYTLGNQLYSGDITAGDLVMMLGEQAVDSMVGGILYVKDNYYLMTNGVETTKNSAFMLGYNSGRAIVELAQIGVSLKGLASLAKNWSALKSSGQGFKTFKELKKALGSAGKGRD